jgi:hypothetical protein
VDLIRAVTARVNKTPDADAVRNPKSTSVAGAAAPVPTKTQSGITGCEANRGLFRPMVRSCGYYCAVAGLCSSLLLSEAPRNDCASMRKGSIWSRLIRRTTRRNRNAMRSFGRSELREAGAPCPGPLDRWVRLAGVAGGLRGASTRESHGPESSVPSFVPTLCV